MSSWMAPSTGMKPMIVRPSVALVRVTVTSFFSLASFG